MLNRVGHAHAVGRGFAAQKLRQYGVIGTAFIPPTVLAVLIVHHWVNVPLLDEWDVPGQLLKEYFVDGQLRWATLFAQHNESRMLFPQLIFLVASILFGWDTRVPQTAVWICAVAMFTQWVWLARHTFSRSPLGRWIVLAVISAVFFSTNQCESWLWGIQLQVFLPPLCLTGCLAVQQSRLQYTLKITFCAALALVSTYSNANGMLCWVLGFPVPTPVAQKDQARADSRELRSSDLGGIVAYSVALLLSIIVYFRGYARPGQHPSLWETFRQPAAFAEYFICWVGHPFCRFLPGDPLPVAFVLGTMTLATLFATIGIVLRNWTAMSDVGITRRLYPWAMLTLYGILSGLITTAGRSSLGLRQALSPRYISFSCYILIGLIGILATLPAWSFGVFRHRSVSRCIWWPCAALLAICFVSDWWNGLQTFKGHRIGEEKMKLTLRLLPLIPDNPALAALYPNPQRLRDLAFPLLTKGVLRQRSVDTWLPDKLRTPDGDDHGWFTVQPGTAGDIVSGWSLLSDRGSKPQCVFLARATPNAEERLITAAPLQSPTVLYGSTRLFVASFSVEIPGNSAAVEGSFRVYSVDFARQRALRIRERSPSL